MLSVIGLQQPEREKQLEGQGLGSVEGSGFAYEGRFLHTFTKNVGNLLESDTSVLQNLVPWELQGLIRIEGCKGIVEESPDNEASQNLCAEVELFLFLGFRV